METTPQDEALLSQGAVAESHIRLKHILVPIDFSECSLKALRYAFSFARQFDAKITLLHIVSVNYGGGEFGAIDFASLEEEMAASARRQLKKILEQEVPQGIKADAVVRVGHAANAITESARQQPADLIILSTHGYTGLKHVLLGSIAENVVRHAPCPVLTVREHEHEFITD